MVQPKRNIAVGTLKTDIRFRLFVLELLRGRELTAAEIRNAILTDYPSKNFSMQNVHNFLKKLRQYQLIKKRRLGERQEDGSFVMYTLNPVEGQKRIDYYKKRIVEENSG